MPVEAMGMSKRNQRPDDNYYRLTNHVCRICFGRVLERDIADDKLTFKCSNCGTETVSANVHSLCCCGMKLRNSKDAGVRCLISPNQRPEMPSEIVAMQVDPTQYSQK